MKCCVVQRKSVLFLRSQGAWNGSLVSQKDFFFLCATASISKEINSADMYLHSLVRRGGIELRTKT